MGKYWRGGGWSHCSAASVVTIAGLLLWQSVFLATVVGASIIVMMLISLSFALLQHFLAKTIVP